MKRIAVVAGGFSSEHVVSLKSAATVMQHLDRNRFEPHLVLIDRNGWRIDEAGGTYAINPADFSVEYKGELMKFDAVFMMIHGTPGEDGKLQGYFDMLGIPYTGCDQLRSALTFNKWACNSFLDHLGFHCAKRILVRKHDTPDHSDILEKLGLPCFVKPNDAGSSFGVSKVKEAGELLPSISKAFAEGSEVLIESLLTGPEITCGVLPLNGRPHALPVTEIVSEGEFFDYAAKYEGKSQEITPARLEPRLYADVQRTAVEVYEKIGLGGLVRIDMIVHQGVPHIIEINTVPGMSAASIVPQQAAIEGITLEELFSMMLDQVLL